jgi:hypothetical protein
MQKVFCMGTQARAMTQMEDVPSACGQGSVACGHQQTGSGNGRKGWGWGARWLETEGGTCGGAKQGDPLGPERCSWPMEARRAARWESERPE